MPIVTGPYGEIMPVQGTAADMYTPTEADIRWATNLVAVLKNNGVWIVPRLGIYKVYHSPEKKMVLISQHGSDVFFYMDVAVFGAIGYQVVKAEQ